MLSRSLGALPSPYLLPPILHLLSPPEIISNEYTTTQLPSLREVLGKVNILPSHELISIMNLFPLLPCGDSLISFGVYKGELRRKPVLLYLGKNVSTVGELGIAQEGMVADGVSGVSSRSGPAISTTVS